jgi:hypothetical protein
MARDVDQAMSPVGFRGNNELARHVADPEAAAAFQVGVLGGTLVSRTVECIEITNGALRLFLLRDSTSSSERPPIQRCRPTCQAEAGSLMYLAWALAHDSPSPEIVDVGAVGGPRSCLSRSCR